MESSLLKLKKQIRNYLKLKDDHTNNVSKEFSKLFKCNSNLISLIDKILTKKQIGERTNKKYMKVNIII